MSAKKSYYEPWPVDFALLELLPDTGLIAGVHWRGRQVKDLVHELNDALPQEASLEFERFDANQLQSRLRSMHVAGHVVSHPGRGGNRIWARTKSGVSLLARKNELLGLDPEADKRAAEHAQMLSDIDDADLDD